jgi:tRNA 2-selenouridine synthase
MRSARRCSTTTSAHASARCTPGRRVRGKKVGAALVSRHIATIVETIAADKPRGWSPLVYCWRGGKRSASLVHVLNEIGFPAVQLDGGYRTWRRHVVARLAELPAAFATASCAG